ncbi:hypothetical protein FJH47_23200 [Salmonella enterica]|nr:hypothetical protein [Salmonella enterica]
MSELRLNCWRCWPTCQSGTWRKVGSGELQIATAQATGWRFPGATATCPTGKRGKRKLTAVCSHQTRIGNLDAHLI